MFASVFVSLLLATLPIVQQGAADRLASAAAAPPAAAAAQAARPPVAWGPMTFHATTVRLEQEAPAEGKTAGPFQCLMVGKARVTFGSGGETDFLIEADRIEVRSDAEGHLSVKAEGNCRYVEEETRCSARSLEFLGGTETTLRLSGDVTVRFGTGAGMRVVTADAMTCQQGKWKAVDKR